MKIVYFVYEDVDVASGISKKISQQITLWKKLGHDVELVSIRKELKSSKVNKIRFIPVSLKSTLLFNQLKKQFDLLNPDIVYMRQMLWFPLLMRILKGYRYVVEINSDALGEYKKQGFFKYLFHRLTSGFLLNKSTGIVSVSKELLATCSLSINKSVVIANGYSFKNPMGVLSSDVRSEQPTKIIFVGSPNQPWHGIDHLEKIASKCPYFEFHVVMQNYECKLPNVRCHGALYGDDLEEMYQMCDIGIGSLAMYRNDMNEASPLKTREYLAHGLPVIFGYTDTDLQGLTESDGLLQLPNSPENIDCIDQFVDFCNRWKGTRVSSDELVRRLSYENKEVLRLAFFKKISNRDT